MIMNNITFTGIKNIGACSMSREISPTETNVRHFLIAQLTDDYNGKDLTEYEKTIKLCTSKKWQPGEMTDNRLIHLMTEYSLNPENEFSETVPKLFLNYKLIPEDSKRMPLFTLIAKLTRKIFNMQNQEYAVAKDFKYGILGRMLLMPGYDMQAIANGFNINYYKFMDMVPFNYNSAVKFSKIINEHIKKQMINYLK